MGDRVGCEAVAARLRDFGRGPSEAADAVARSFAAPSDLVCLCCFSKLRCERCELSLVSGRDSFVSDSTGERSVHWEPRRACSIEALSSSVTEFPAVVCSSAASSAGKKVLLPRRCPGGVVSLSSFSSSKCDSATAESARWSITKLKVTSRRLRRDGTSSGTLPAELAERRTGEFHIAELWAEDMRLLSYELLLLLAELVALYRGSNNGK
jgi:hypothetical protein